MHIYKQNYFTLHPMNKTAIVIGSGFSGMSTATHLAKMGWQVTVLEKHNTPGGRARQFTAEGFTFDMGPSWYWMPDVFERYFAQFGKQVSDYYSLTRLDPSYRIYWPNSSTDIPASLDKMYDLFESYESGGAKQLEKFLAEAKFKYETGVNKLVYKPGQSILEFADMDVIKGVFKLDVFSNMQQHVHKFFTHPHLRYLMEFPVLFLGALAKDTPALYSLMNYADIVGGTWWPDGGMYQIVHAMHQLAQEKGVQFVLNADVQKLDVHNGKITNVLCKDGKQYTADVIISSADYHHTETKLLEAPFRNYTEQYWDSRKMAPSSLLYYVGINKKLENVPHHSLYFDVDFNAHAAEIYTTKQWPKEPLFYVSVTSASDTKMAPAGCENLFFLIPITAGLADDNEQRHEAYFMQIVQRMEKHIGQSILPHIVYKRSFGTTDFIADYNSYKGNAYGLANTLMQTAILKPSITNKHVSNLFYTGQLTVPGPGVPPSLISGEVVAKWVNAHGK
jgi:phytoene desaturase